MDIDTKNAWVSLLRTTDAQQICAHLSNECGGRCGLGLLCDVLGIDISEGTQECNKREAQAYDALRKSGIAVSFFWPLNDIRNLTFSEIADVVDAMSLDHPAFNFVEPPRPDRFADR